MARSDLSYGDDGYRCPAGEQLNYVGLNHRNRAHAYIGGPDAADMLHAMHNWTI